MEALIAAVVGVVGVIVGAWITGAYQQAKVKSEADKDAADANEQIRKTVMGLLEPLQKQIADQNAKIKSQDTVISEFKPTPRLEDLGVFVS